MAETADEIAHEVEPQGVAEVAPQWYPSVYLEISGEQLKLLEVGKNVQIKLLGKVKGLNSNEMDTENNRYSIDLELKKVSIVDDDNEFSKMAEDDE